MKLHIIFIVIDILILVAYPVVFLVNKMRRIFQIKR
jgi:hypothetical protein